MPDPSVHVLLVDDDDIVRAGIRVVLDASDGPVRVTEAASIREAGVALDQSWFDVALVSSVLPDGAGHELCDAGDVGVWLVYADARAAGTRLWALVSSIRSTLIEEQPGSEGEGAGPFSVGLLDKRQEDIFRLLGRGHSNAEIGAALHLAESTVSNHITELLTKLRMRRRSEAAALAARLSLRDPHPGPEGQEQ